MILFVQIPQAVPLDLFETVVVQICPFLHCHLSFFPLPTVTVEGSQPYASFANLGLRVFKSLNPSNVFLFEQIGQFCF